MSVADTLVYMYEVISLSYQQLCVSDAGLSQIFQSSVAYLVGVREAKHPEAESFLSVFNTKEWPKDG